MSRPCGHSLSIFLAALAFAGLFAADASAFTVDVKDGAGNAVSGFRWLVEEDTTHLVVPGTFDAESPGVGIHSSHAPVLANGHEDGSSVDIDLPDDGRYMVSVLPDEGYTMSGANVACGQTDRSRSLSTPTRSRPPRSWCWPSTTTIATLPDIPAEQGLEGFTVQLSDMVGQQMLDAFGNMLGTTYMLDADGTFVLDGDGNPIVDMMGDGLILTDANGEALIKYLAPGKYGVRVIPPGGEGWIQTATIEGTPPSTPGWGPASRPTWSSSGLQPGTSSSASSRRWTCPPAHDGHRAPSPARS